MAIVEIIGCLIREIAMSDEGEQESREKKLNNLFDLLTERYLDLSSYVRAKVITTLSKLCELPVKFPKQRLTITELTIGALEDKGSSVRRHAVALLTKLILTHPYGLMHGGLLKLEEWEERYSTVCKDLEELDKKLDPGAGEPDDSEEEDEEESEEEDDEEDAQPETSDADEGQSSDANGPITSSPMKAARKRIRYDIAVVLKFNFVLMVFSSSRPSSRKGSSVPLYTSSDDEPMPAASQSEGEDGEPRSEGAQDVEMGDEAEAPAEGLPGEEGFEGNGGEGDFQQDEGFYEAEEDDIDENVLPGETPARPKMTRSVAPTPLRTPKTPWKTPGRPIETKTPRTIHKSAFKSAKKSKKKKPRKPRKSQLDISTLTDEQVALAALQSNQILSLKLRKRYYAEALNFIRQIEGAVDIIGQLLGSKNKAEVLESIEFFRVAHEYQFEGAEVGSVVFTFGTLY